MKACGIIAEYNPFHLGHRYQLEEARKRSQADVMVVAMSGNFVQRGEPAIENKWYRAQEALNAGSDLVLEIPTLACCQASDWFAAAGVGILLSSQCQAISFGVEAEEHVDFERALHQWDRIEQQLKELLTEKENQQFSYAKRLAMTVRDFYGEESELYRLLQQPNQQLAFSYLRALKKQKKALEIYPIERKGSQHHDCEIEEQIFASGTALRKALISGRNKVLLHHQLPYLEKMPHTAYCNYWENYWELLYYQLAKSTIEELREIYQVDEGIEYRIKKILPQAASFQQFMELLKTKRWPWVRLQRMCVYILLGIKRIDIEEYFKRELILPSQITVLAFNSNGRAYLKALKEAEVQFMTDYAHPALERQKNFDRIYDIANPSRETSAQRFKPVMK